MLQAFKTHLSRACLAACLALSAPAWAAVDVNQATAADLDSVKGIGPGTSAKIAEARKAGPFKDWADLIERVKGIGPGSAAKLSANGLTVNGVAYSGSGAAPASRPAAKAADAPAAKVAASAAAAPANKPVEPPKKP